jgi:hypothetical protein
MKVRLLWEGDALEIRYIQNPRSMSRDKMLGRIAGGARATGDGDRRLFEKISLSDGAQVG